MKDFNSKHEIVGSNFIAFVVKKKRGENIVFQITNYQWNSVLDFQPKQNDCRSNKQFLLPPHTLCFFFFL